MGKPERCTGKGDVPVEWDKGKLLADAELSSKLTETEFVANVEAQGLPTKLSAQTREQRLKEQFGFRIGGTAEYAMFEGCYMPVHFGDGLKAFHELVSYYQVDLSLIPRPRCCSSMLFSNALRARDEERLNRAAVIARRNIEEDIKQAKSMGAKALVLFCAGCEAVFGKFRDSVDFELLWYPELIERFFDGGKLELKADYYAGCYKLSRKLGSFPNLGAVDKVLKRIKGLEVNYLENELCCIRPNELDLLANQCKNDLVISICGNCHNMLDTALKKMGKRGSISLPELVLQAVRG